MDESGQGEYLTMNSRYFLLHWNHFDGAVTFWTQFDHPDQCAVSALNLEVRILPIYLLNCFWVYTNPFKCPIALKNKVKKGWKNKLKERN